MKLRVIPTALILALGFLLTGCRKEMPPQVAQLIRSTVEAETLPASIEKEQERARAWEALARFYEERQFEPVWSEPRGPRPQAEELLRSIPELARREGLDPGNYPVQELARLAARVEEDPALDTPEGQQRLAELDLKLTQTWLTLASQIDTGRVQPEELRLQWKSRESQADLAALLAAAFGEEEGDVTTPLRSLAPPNPEYDRLRQALARYRGIAAQGGQVEGQIRRIELNMERWRWLPDDLGDRYILVNVPDFHMELVENGRRVLDMPVVVGKRQSQTPVFSDTMTYVELNPVWNLPSSIAGEEIVPKLASDPGYLARNDMEVVRGWTEDAEPVDPWSIDPAELGNPRSEYRLRQRPGPQNPLGQIKFMFPNEFDIYLHDTPADHLFSRSERGFSHGCIRLERPVQLAEYLFRNDPNWSGGRIREAIVSGEQQSVKLPEPIPVHIVYLTARPGADGAVRFQDDIYGHDARLARALAEEPPVPADFPAVGGEAIEKTAQQSAVRVKTGRG